MYKYRNGYFEYYMHGDIVSPKDTITNLVRPVHFTVKVVDPEGQPVEGARVWVSLVTRRRNLRDPVNELTSSTDAKSYFTDKDGNIPVNCKAMVLRLNVAHDPYETSNAGFSPTPSSETIPDVVVIRLKRK